MLNVLDIVRPEVNSSVDEVSNLLGYSTMWV